VEKYPWIVQVGVAVLSWTAAKMIVSEPLFKEWFEAHAAASVGVYVFVFSAVFGLGFLAQRRRSNTAAQAA
jgi:predicted tellurium resistance membrane protein TerC